MIEYVKVPEEPAEWREYAHIISEGFRKGLMETISPITKKVVEVRADGCYVTIVYTDGTKVAWTCEADTIAETVAQYVNTAISCGFKPRLGP